MVTISSDQEEPRPDSYRLKNPGLPKGLSQLSTEGGGGEH